MKVNPNRELVRTFKLSHPFDKFSAASGNLKRIAEELEKQYGNDTFQDNDFINETLHMLRVSYASKMFDNKVSLGESDVIDDDDDADQATPEQIKLIDDRIAVDVIAAKEKLSGIVSPVSVKLGWITLYAMAFCLLFELNESKGRDCYEFFPCDPFLKALFQMSQRL